MAGIDPALLSHLGGGQAAHAAPHAGDVAPGKSSPDSGEPAGCGQACRELSETVQSAAQMAQDLQAQVEMEDDVDPAAEKAVAQAAQLLTQVNGLLLKASKALGGPGESEPDGDESAAAY